MDIQAGIQTAVAIVVLGVLLSIWAGILSIRSGRKLAYYRLRQSRVARGWRLFFLAICLVGAAFWLEYGSRPVIYQFYPPSPTPTLTPTITPTATITLTATITNTPSVSDTPTGTSTPFVPAAVQKQFTSIITPNPDAIFSQLVFARDMDLTTYDPIDAGTVFQNPIKRIVAIFTYDKMIPGVQWTALWYRDGNLVHFETKPWDGTTGGHGFTDWSPDPSAWLPGEYQVQIFTGLDWRMVGRFSVQGKPPPPLPTPRPSGTVRPTVTPPPPGTATLTPTKVSTLTPRPSPTKPPTTTPRPSATPAPTDTPWPSATPTYTKTPTLTHTPRPTNTARPTLVK